MIESHEMHDPSDIEKFMAVVYRVAGWMMAGLVIGSVICFSRPKLYRSRTVLASNETRSGTVPLSPIHAAQALRLTADKLEGEPTAEKIADLCKHTQITAIRGAVVITVEHPWKFAAYEIANELMWLFRNMDEEVSLAQHSTDLPLRTESYLKLAQDRRKVEDLMKNDARDAINSSNYRMIPLLAANGSAPASELWKSESFQLHWKFHQNATGQLAGDPRSERPILPVLELPEIADVPASPRVQLYLQTGLLGGLLFGTFMGLRKIRMLSAEQPIRQPNLPPPVKPPSRGKTLEEEW
ncbi:MAG: hypothetical protein ABIT37_12900 [Luteolibacter sp.]